MLDEPAPNILYVGDSASKVRGIIASSGAVITDVVPTSSTGGDIFCVDFTNATEKWFAVGVTSVMQAGVQALLGYSVKTNNSNTIGEFCSIARFVKYWGIGANSKNYSEQSKLSLSTDDGAGGLVSIMTCSPFFKEFYGKNVGITVSSSAIQRTYCTWGFFAPLSKSFDLEGFINDYVTSGLTYGVTSFSAADTKTLVTSSFGNLAKIMCADKCALVLNCSTMTASSDTWYIGSPLYTNNNAVEYNIPSELFIIPPDMNIQWAPSRTRIYSNALTEEVYISPRALKFLADNSPNVSSRTLTIGSGNIAHMNSYDPTIITTLQSKGWTVQ